MSRGNHRNTPEEVTDPVREFWGTIACDPCSNSFSTVRATVEYDITKGIDGLADSSPWFDKTFINPPWTDIFPWAYRAVDESCRGVQSMLWIPFYPETEYSRMLYATRAVVCAWASRVNHPNEGKLGSGSQWPTQLVYLGREKERFAYHFRRYGTVFEVAAPYIG